MDHLPASDTVPSPLKFLGRAVGTPGELTYAKDIYRYYEALAKAAPGRAKYWKVGTTEEGRDIVLLAIADEATIKSLDKYRDMLGELTDPRKTTRSQAQQLLHTAKPIYYAISGMHSPETGGPEMLIELAYRLIVEETPFIQNIRNNVITLITPVIEVDGREKQVDTYYFNKKRAPGDARLPLMYWGKYVQHDNNRDGMGQFLKLTQAVTKETLEWHPTVIHDLHEAQTYLYSSTGTGPYNNDIDPIVVSEWWTLAQNDVMEMTKRGVPGVWTYGFYDGWVPNYMFFIAHSHNSIGRFYEVQSYGPDPYEVRPGATMTSKEWFRPNPPLPQIKWGPRNNTNIQQSALLFSLSHVAKNKDLYLENYWLKNKRAVDKGKTGPTYAWVIPAAQRRKADAARRGQRAARCRGSKCRAPRLRSRPAASTSRRATTSSAATSRSARWRTCTSRSRTTRRRIRRRTTTPAGPSSTCATSRSLPVGEKSHPRPADDDADGGCEGAGRHRRHRQRAGRRSHGGQQPGHVPLQEQGREDGGGGRRLRARPATSSAPARS